MLKALVWAVLLLPTAGAAAPIPAFLPVPIPGVHAQAVPLPTTFGGEGAALTEDVFSLDHMADVADPMDRSNGHAMWDAMGTGCIDGGGVDDPFPGGKGDLRVAAFCIPQPCARLMSRDELAFEVLGRPLRDEEYETYLARYRVACSEWASFDGFDALITLVSVPEGDFELPDGTVRDLPPLLRQVASKAPTVRFTGPQIAPGLKWRPRDHRPTPKGSPGGPGGPGSPGGPGPGPGGPGGGGTPPGPETWLPPDEVPLSPVPLPATLPAMLLAMATLAGMRFRRAR